MTQEIMNLNNEQRETFRQLLCLYNRVAAQHGMDIPSVPLMKRAYIATMIEC